MEIVSETEKKEIPESTVDEEDELTDQHSYNIIVRENFSGICLSVGGKSSALPGETVYVSADTDNMSAGMYFNGITVRTSDEKSLETAYDVSCGMYRFIMPESDVAVTPSHGWITLMANSIGTTHTVTNYSTMMNQGSLMVGYFEIDGGTLAWCTQHSLDPPIIGRRMTTLRFGPIIAHGFLQ